MALDFSDCKAFFKYQLGNSLPGNNFLKRLFDVVGSVFLLCLLSPCLFAIVIAIKLDSAGKVIFKQRRIGKYGKSYEILKFRTMVDNAEHMGTGLFSYAGDSRITRVGKFLRASSLDELPQLINVLKGEMSLVGPRPPVVNELGDFSSLSMRYKKRFMVRPGITGLAQVVGRNAHSWEEKITYDNIYVDKLASEGIFIDFFIILKTVIQVIFSKGIIEEKKFSNDDIESAVLADKNVKYVAHTRNSLDDEFDQFIRKNYDKKKHR